MASNTYVYSEDHFPKALTDRLAGFSFKSLKPEQRQCIRWLICVKEDVLVILPTGFGKEHHLSASPESVGTLCDPQRHGLDLSSRFCANLPRQLLRQCNPGGGGTPILSYMSMCRTFYQALLPLLPFSHFLLLGGGGGGPDRRLR